MHNDLFHVRCAVVIVISVTWLEMHALCYKSCIKHQCWQSVQMILGNPACWIFNQFIFIFLVYLMTVSVTGCVMPGGRMLLMMQHLLGGTEENHKPHSKMTVWIIPQSGSLLRSSTFFAICPLIIVLTFSIVQSDSLRTLSIIINKLVNKSR